MATARSVFRTHVGRGLGRSYWVESTTTSISTDAYEVIDSKRTEPADYWAGATLLIGTEEITVNGGDPETGKLFLDSAVAAGTPASGTAIKLLKGFSISDMDEGIDVAHADAYPYLYLPVNDRSTFSETDNTFTYTLTEAWRDITTVRREIDGSSPTRYEDLPHDYYVIRQGTTGLEMEVLYTPKTGINLWFVGKAIMTLGSSASDTSLAPWQVITPGALAWMYEKGANPDEASLAQRFAQEAQKQLALFEAAKSRYAMPRDRRRAWTPNITVNNDGSTVPSAF